VKSSRKIFAFALVEIVLALGVAAFALVAVMGLLSVGMGSSKNSTDDTVLVTMANGMIGDLRREYFVDNTLVNGVPTHAAGSQTILTSGVLPGTNDIPQGTTPAVVTPSPTIFFDVSGMRLQNTDLTDMDRTTALTRGAVYQCAVKLQGDASTLSSVGSDGSTSTQAVNLLNVTLTFTWPAAAGTPPPNGAAPNTKIIHASISRH
jgi:hypothetical protein